MGKFSAIFIVVFSTLMAGGCEQLNEARNAIAVDTRLASCLRLYPLLRTLDNSRLEDTSLLRGCLRQILGLTESRRPLDFLSRWRELGFVCSPVDVSQSAQCILSHNERIYGIRDRTRFSETQNYIRIYINNGNLTGLYTNRIRTSNLNDVIYEVSSNNLI